MNLNLPLIYLLPTNLPPAELHSLEEAVPSLTWDANEADLIVGKITRRERALFELRRLKLKTQELPPRSNNPDDENIHVSKKRKLSGSREDYSAASLHERSADEAGSVESDAEHIIKVLKLSWLTDSLEKGVRLPTEGYVLYEGKKLRSSHENSVGSRMTSPSTPQTSRSNHSTITAEAHTSPSQPARHSAHAHASQSQHSSHKPALLHQTTSEHDLPLPPVPVFLHTTYSCQRPTPGNTPNASFVEELKQVRTLRTLEGDQVGVRAYSTSIATIAAYPYPLQSTFGSYYSFLKYA